MNKIKLFFIGCAILPFASKTQTINEGFDNVLSLYSNGWWATNNSNPTNANIWYQDGGNFTAFSGAANSSITTGWYCTDNSGTGDASNWLFTPPVNLYNGDTLRFYTISFNNSEYPDRLEVRLNVSGSDTIVGSTSTSVGNYTNLVLTINPSLDTASYPLIWTPYEIVLSGLPGGQGRIAFRYNVPNTGGSGVNGSVIGIDDFEFVPGALTVKNDELQSKWQLFPNPANDEIIVLMANESVSAIRIYNAQGIVVYSKNSFGERITIDISELQDGIYFFESRTDKSITRKSFVKSGN